MCLGSGRRWRLWRRCAEGLPRISSGCTGERKQTIGGASSGAATTQTRLAVAFGRRVLWDLGLGLVWRAREANRVVKVAEKMTGVVIDGKETAAGIRKEVKRQVQALEEKYGAEAGTPGLATVLVGSRTDSATYVRMKHKACAEVGIKSIQRQLPEDITQEALLEVVRALNQDPLVHGILVQLPLPSHINEEAILAEVALEKDVDGFHPLNIGKLAMKGRQPLFVPCTPLGIMELLRRHNISLAGKHAVVLGRSNIVGMPVAMLLVKANATVTVCHSQTTDLPGIVKQADVLVAAVGRAEMVKADWIKPGAVVIDVGINSKDDPSSKKGYRLVGDVAYDECASVASMITPVPGGTGPMTIAMLLQNCATAASRTLGAST
ncbi:Bifunctional protein FolD 2 [Porphyridium purpureum]|uniref:Bifunctional protein FolD 2 n=1 Tax=Porphyridium purpureum TaxID=35688 RepID=A0A5J4Z9R6_PORPP|nr:Bifunctional protein FolD 2 [Porphyridium purpureum]|eukprot:POR8456..scf295_1